MQKKLNLIIIIVGVFLFSFAVFNITFSWFSSLVSSGNNDLATSGVLDIDYVSGNNIVNGTLRPSVSKNEGLSTTIKIKRTNSSISAIAGLNLNIVELADALENTNAINWEVYRNDETNALAFGTFSGVYQGDVIRMVSDVLLTTEYITYTIYIWLNGELATNQMQRQPFNATVTAYANQTNYVSD